MFYGFFVLNKGLFGRFAVLAAGPFDPDAIGMFSAMQCSAVLSTASGKIIIQ